MNTSGTFRLKVGGVSVDDSIGSQARSVIKANRLIFRCAFCVRTGHHQQSEQDDQVSHSLKVITLWPPAKA